MKVLTAKGGDFQVSDEMRSMLALLEDGRLIISKTAANNPHVRGFVGRLDRLGVQYSLHHADLSVVLSFYDDIGAKEKQSDMQMAARLLFDKAVSARASDIHIRISSKSRSQIFFRVHNDLEFVEEHPYEYGNKLCSTIYQAMADVSDSTFEPMSRQDARISGKEKLPSRLDGIRIATTPQVDGYIMVLRLLYNDTTEDLDLEKLGYDQRQILLIHRLMKKPTGVIVIGGPTGSGKSTTLQRVLGTIIRDTQGRKHIITVEDPPEYPIRGAVQTPVSNAHTEEERSRAFQKAIKASMRLDPDIIMLSEVRDQPTAKLVIQAAMTGHQVWTTVHANSDLAILDRLSDLGVSQEFLYDPTIIAGLICQRLIKSLCPHCKVPLTDKVASYKDEDLQRVLSVAQVEKIFVQGEGCDSCSGSGVSGRTVVAEVVVTDNLLMEYMKFGHKPAAYRYVRKDLGCLSMLDHAIQKVERGLIDPFHAEDIVGPLDAKPIDIPDSEPEHPAGSL